MSFINTVFGIPLGYVMWGCYQLVKNYGLSIILFTLVSKIVMLPVSIMVQKNSIRMIQIQPQINEIKYKHAGDKDRIADEQMELFKKAHYSPMLGMVPMLLQIPLVLGLINVIYNPMQHLMHIKTSVCDQIVAATCSLMGVNQLGSGAQLQAMAALQNPDNLSFFQNALAGTGIDIEAIAAQAATINTHFLGLDLSVVPHITVLAWILLIPLFSCLSTVLLCACQNQANVLQKEQGALGQWGVTIFTVAFSTYFTFLVPGGVGLYWIFSNLFSTALIYILNAVYNPKKYIDYEALEESKRLLAEQKAVEDAYKKKMAPYKAKEKEDYKRFFAKDNENKQLMFYSESSGFYKYYRGMIEELLENSDIVIHYVTSDPEDQVFQIRHERFKAYYVGEIKLITLMMKLDCDIVVMTMPDLETYHIKRSYVRKDMEYIHVPHSIDSMNMTYRKGSIDHFDTIFCVGPHHKDEVEKMEETYDLPHKVLLNWGYCLLDDMRKDYESKEKVINEQKTILIGYLTRIANLIGIKTPKIACIAPSEQLLPSVLSSTEAALLAKMGDRGQLGNVVIDGPLSLDVALYKEAAEIKKVKGSSVAGDADCLLFPNIESGNVFFKASTHMGGGEIAAMVMGTKVPCVLTSRGDSSLTKLYSIALACLAAK